MHYAMRVVLVILVGIGMTGRCLWWLEQENEHVHVEVTGSTEPHLGLPVYAQFIVTQTYRLEEPIRLSRLVVPLYIPNSDLALRVRLFRNGEIVASGRTPDESGDTQAIINFPQPILIDGLLEIQFDGSHISHEHMDEAPRLYIESDDLAFRAGSYRIAENEKSGDVAFLMYEKVGNGFVFIEDVQRYPLRTLISPLKFAPLIIVLLTFPIPFLPGKPSVGGGLRAL